MSFIGTLFVIAWEFIKELLIGLIRSAPPSDYTWAPLPPVLDLIDNSLRMLDAEASCKSLWF